jgi:hypothetical protein
MTPTEKLSKLQRFVLQALLHLERETPVSYPPRPGDRKRFNASIYRQFFGLDGRFMESKFNAPRAALCRSNRNLEARGLVESSRFGFRLTEAGRVVAEAASRKGIASGYITNKCTANN